MSWLWHWVRCNMMMVIMMVTMMMVIMMTTTTIMMMMLLMLLMLMLLLMPLLLLLLLLMMMMIMTMMMMMMMLMMMIVSNFIIFEFRKFLIWSISGQLSWFLIFSVAISTVPKATAQSFPAYCEYLVNECHDHTIPSGGVYTGFTGSPAEQRAQWTQFCL